MFRLLAACVIGAVIIILPDMIPMLGLVKVCCCCCFWPVLAGALAALAWTRLAASGSLLMGLLVGIGSGVLATGWEIGPGAASVFLNPGAVIAAPDFQKALQEFPADKPLDAETLLAVLRKANEEHAPSEIHRIRNRLKLSEAESNLKEATPEARAKLERGIAWVDGVIQGLRKGETRWILIPVALGCLLVLGIKTALTGFGGLMGGLMFDGTPPPSASPPVPAA